MPSAGINDFVPGPSGGFFATSHILPQNGHHEPSRTGLSYDAMRTFHGDGGYSNHNGPLLSAQPDSVPFAGFFASSPQTREKQQESVKTSQTFDILQAFHNEHVRNDNSSTQDFLQMPTRFSTTMQPRDNRENHQECSRATPSLDAFRSFQGSAGFESNSRMPPVTNSSFAQMSSSPVPAAHSQQRDTRNSQPAQNKVMPSFDALRAFQGDDGSDSDSDTGYGCGKRIPSDHESTSASGGELTGRAYSSDEGESSSHSKDSKVLTCEEVQEAEEVLRLAFNNVRERDTMRAKVSTASSAEIQAMLNARLKNA